jgi:chemotaxis protein histidine kinase CheA
VNRIDRHISWVQSKLAGQRFLDALAIAVTAFCAAVLVAVVVTRTVQLHAPRPAELCGGLAVAGVAAAGVWAMFRRPTPMQAAIAIDRQLGLKEKFSTALQFRDNPDPFAAAAVRDAEATADNVTLSKQFPLHFPRAGSVAIVAAVVLGAALLWWPQLDLLGRQARARQLAVEQVRHAQARATLTEALATVNSYPKAVASNEQIQLAKRDLETALNQASLDPENAKRTAFKALQQSGDAVKDEIRKSDQFARAQDQQRLMRAMSASPDQQGPVADAQRDIAKGDFSSAVQKLNEAANKFDKMSAADQQKAAQQMANLARQLSQMAQSPAQQQQLQQQLQQMGASKQQAQQLQQMMQQAAAGNPQAQQQMQKLQQQLQKQVAKTGTPQQQQAMQKMMQKMQAQAANQQTAQQMAQSAQQMAQAMQQSAKQGGQQQQQQASGQQQGQQPGQQSGMGQAQQQMQEALGQMDAVQKDAQEMAAAQDSTSKAESDAASDSNNPTGNGNGNGGDKPGGNSKDKSGSDSTGKWGQGDPQGKWGNGMGGPGHGNGGNGQKTQAPYTVKREVDPTQNIDNGKILASTFVKAGTIKGDSKVGLSQAAAAAQNDAADEVDEESVSKESQKVVKQYFQTMQEGQ